MPPRRKPSRKRSAASSTGLPDSVVFYLDESIYSRVLVEALRAAGARLEHVRGAVPAGLPDAEWLAIAGRNGWIVLMRDQRIRYRTIERDALKRAAVGAFVFTGGQATARDTAEAIVPKLRKMGSIATSERKPFLYSLSARGSLTRVPL